MADQLDTYKKYFVDNGFERLSLFEILRDTYQLTSAIYLGSFVHVTPAFVFQRTSFIDSDRRVQKFFDSDEVLDFVNKNKQYNQDPEIFASQQNYEKPILGIKKHDLLISQYAGFVSQAGKKYLKKDGILIVNGSHGDASMAILDEDYKFIAVANHTKDKWRISDKNLQKYFIAKNAAEDSAEILLATMTGTAYTKTASNYIFRKNS